MSDGKVQDMGSESFYPSPTYQAQHRDEVCHVLRSPAALMWRDSPPQDTNPGLLLSAARKESWVEKTRDLGSSLSPAAHLLCDHGQVSEDIL